jgi:hypothetical protein
MYLQYFIQQCFIFRPSDSTVSADAGMGPRTVATSALAVRRSNARSHPCLGYISSTIIKTNIHVSRTIFHWGNVVNNGAMFRSTCKYCMGPVWHTRKDVWMSWDDCVPLIVFNSLWESGKKNSQKPLSAVPLLLMPPLYNDLWWWCWLGNASSIMTCDDDAGLVMLPL